MTNEEMQRTMEFIIQQQAQFAANIQRLQEERIRDNPRLLRLEESFQLLVQLAQTTDIRLDRLESTSAALESNMAALESNMAALAAAQLHTDERLSTSSTSYAKTGMENLDNMLASPAAVERIKDCCRASQRAATQSGRLDWMRR